MPKLGLGTGFSRSGLVVPGVVTDGLVMKHMYPAGSVQPISDAAVYFNGPGADDYIDCGAINVGTTFSAGGWFWINSTGQDQYATLLGQAIYDSIGGHIEGFILRLSTNNLQLSFGDDSIGANDSITITNFLTTTGNNNNWVHLYFTISADATGSKISKLYQNGALIATDTIVNFEGVHSSSNFTIGKADSLNASESALNGYASNVSLYSTELTQAQIKSIMFKQYADLTTSQKTNLVSWWNLDSTVADDIPLIYDENNTTLGANLWDGGDVGPDSLGDADGHPSHSMDISDVGLAAGDVIKLSGTISGSNGGRIICPDVAAGSNGVTRIPTDATNEHTTDGDIVRYLYVSDVTGVLKIRTDFDGSGDNQDDRTQKITNISVQKITNAGRLL
tara:strand:- start:6186 stop:7361 length:1176 start_codon:yes stop_codon:yes gene_type:complete